MAYFIGFGILAALIGLVAGRKTIWRLLRSVSAQFNKLGRAAMAADPVAVYQGMVDDAEQEILEGTKGLTEHRGNISQLERRIETDTKEIAVLDARAKNAVANGDDAAALRAITSKTRLETSLEGSKRQLASFQKMYETCVKRVQAAKDKVHNAKEKAKILSVDLKLSKVEAATAELAQSFNVSSRSLGQLNEVEDEIQRQIDTNRAKSQVLSDLGDDGLAEIEAEEKARTASAAELLAKMKADLKPVA